MGNFDVAARVQQIHHGREVPSIIRQIPVRGVHEKRGDSLGNARFPKDATVTPSRGHYSDPPTGSSLPVDQEIAGGLVRRAGYVHDACGIQPAVANAGGKLSGAFECRGRGKCPAKAGGLRCRHARPEQAARFRRVQFEQPLPDGPVEQIECAGVRQQIEHAVEARDGLEQPGMITSQIEEGELLHQSITADQ